MNYSAAKDGPVPAGAVYALSIHADYQCRRSGVCCTSDWDVPVELPVYRSLGQALATGTLRPSGVPTAGDQVLMGGPDLPDNAAAMVARTQSGDCVFYHRGSGLCVVHQGMGEAHLPATCRHFPRLAVRDRRGCFITLTHYCPTAAAMLFRDDVPLEIVEGPAAFPPAEYEGLHILPEEWPPLLHPRMLMDHGGYSAWERHMVSRCADERLSPEDVIATLEHDARSLRQYRPGNGSIAEAVARLPEAVARAQSHVNLADSLAMFAEVIEAVPEEFKPEPDEAQLPEAYFHLVRPSWHLWHAPMKRFLAAKAFASWTAYQGRGVLTIVRGLESALGLVRVEAARVCRDAAAPLDRDLLREAFRQADFVLNHLAAADELAEGWSRVENGKSKVRS